MIRKISITNRINIFVRIDNKIIIEGKQMVKIFIAHPQKLVCTALTDILEKFGDFSVVGTSCDFASARDFFSKNEIEVFLTSDRLSDCTGVYALRQMKSNFPQIKSVFYCMGGNSALFDYLAARHGAAAVIPASSSYSELVSVVKSVAESRRDPMQSRIIGRVRKLSQRELDVLTGILEGLSLAETAELLQINEKTVSTYKNRLFHKLGVKNTVELIGVYNYGDKGDLILPVARKE